METQRKEAQIASVLPFLVFLTKVQQHFIKHFNSALF